MYVSFIDQQLEDLYEKSIKEFGKYKFPQEAIKKYKKVVDILKYAADPQTLPQFPSLHYEKLKEKQYEGCCSVCINDKYRVIFKYSSDNQLSVVILELCNHYD